jgi:hypothetical protein
MQQKIMLHCRYGGVGSHGDQLQVSLWIHRKGGQVGTHFNVARGQQTSHHCCNPLECVECVEFVRRTGLLPQAEECADDPRVGGVMRSSSRTLKRPRTPSAFCSSERRDPSLHLSPMPTTPDARSSPFQLGWYISPSPLCPPNAFSPLCMCGVWGNDVGGSRYFGTI